MANSKFLFILLLIAQFIALVYYHWNYSSQSSHIEFIVDKNQQLLSQIDKLGKELERSHQIEKNCSLIIKEFQTKHVNRGKPAGVAVTLMYDHPKWFQRRYTTMIQNTLNNIPKDWVIQIFHPNNDQFRTGLAINGGILKLLQTYPNRIFFTALPSHVTNERKRPIHIMTHSWLWENMMSDMVLVFGGNFVICSNSPYKLEDFLSYDYISAPWHYHHGVGGGSGMSLRNRVTMLSLIYNKLNQTEAAAREKAYLDWGRGEELFVGDMINTNKQKNQEQYRLPSKEVCSSSSVYCYYFDSRCLFDCFC